MTEAIEKLMSKGAYRFIFATDDRDLIKQKYPTLTLQCFKCRKIEANNDVQKIRITLSDGEFYLQGVWTVPPDQKDVQIPIGSIVELTEYDSYVMSENRPVIMILKWKIVCNTSERIGSPVQLVSALEVRKNITNNGNGAPSTKVETKPVSSYNQSSSRGRNSNILAIEGLSPYTNNWKIRARVGNKSEIRKYRNKNGEGQLFNVTFLDESGEIRATGFGETVDKLYPLLQEGQVYFVSKCTVNLAKKQFSTVNNEYELIFDRDCMIEPCGDIVDVPTVKYNFTPLDKLVNIDNNGLADVIAVLKDFDDCTQITSKTTGRPFDKRDLSLVDRSGVSVKCTIWGKQALEFSTPVESVMAMKSVKVSDFGGRSLSMFNSTTLTVNPDIPEAHTLKGWYDTQGKTQSFNSLQAASDTSKNMDDRRNPRYSLEEVLSNQLGMSEKDEYFSTRAFITYIRRDGLTYPSCGTCRKKVVQETDGETWRCEKCNVTMSEPVHRYLMSFCMNDHSGQIWGSCFDEAGAIIIGKSANDLVKIIDDETSEALANELSKALFVEYVFNIRARPDNYNENQGVRYQVLSVNPVDPVAESTKLLEKIKLYD